MKISKEVAAQVLYFFGQGGYEAGSFTSKLLSAISNADSTNRLRLALGFPELVSAVNMAQYDSDGIDNLKAILNNTTKEN